ncbi:unnamed protein product [Closterium sp. Naga37s-1]|nr:unnamed protein product [Closterium sp. Naga37s-1]
MLNEIGRKLLLTSLLSSTAVAASSDISFLRPLHQRSTPINSSSREATAATAMPAMAAADRPAVWEVDVASEGGDVGEAVRGNGDAVLLPGVGEGGAGEGKRRDGEKEVKGWAGKGWSE